MGESFLYVALADHRNLNGIYTDFIELLRKKSLEEIFFKMLLRKKYCGFAVYLQIKSLTKIFDQNTQLQISDQKKRKTNAFSVRIIVKDFVGR